MKVIILAGGKGERLRPLTHTVPKPMIRINNKPLVEYSIDLFKKNKLTDITLTICHLPQVLKRYFGTGNKFGIKISYFIEKPIKPLGTAGALALLQDKPTQSFIVCSGDTIRSCNINKIIKFHKNKKGIATICAYNNKKQNPKSIIKFNKNDRILKFVERPSKLPKDIIWSNASLYILEPEILQFIPKDKPSDFGKDIFPKLLKNKKKLFVYKEKGYFLDIGTNDKIEIAQNDIKNRSLSFK